MRIGSGDSTNEFHLAGRQIKRTVMSFPLGQSLVAVGLIAFGTLIEPTQTTATSACLASWTASFVFALDDTLTDAPAICVTPSRMLIA